MDAFQENTAAMRGDEPNFGSRAVFIRFEKGIRLELYEYRDPHTQFGGIR